MSLRSTPLKTPKTATYPLHVNRLQGCGILPHSRVAAGHFGHWQVGALEHEQCSNSPFPPPLCNTLRNHTTYPTRTVYIPEAPSIHSLHMLCVSHLSLSMVSVCNCPSFPFRYDSTTLRQHDY